MAGAILSLSSYNQHYDRTEMLKAFDETKAGVKGLTDSGLPKVPKIFVRPPEELLEESTYQKSQVQVPVIDLSDIENVDRRNRTVDQVRMASEKLGFFQVVNHGILQRVLDGMIDGVRRFNDQDVEERRRYYVRDPKRRVQYRSNFDLFGSRTANWRDTLTIAFSNSNEGDEALPASCRGSTEEYSRHVDILGNTLLELLSEALGLKSDYLKNITESSNGHALSCHYYPACPQPELTIGTTQHCDPGFLTVVLQNQISGLQVLYEGQWVDVEPNPGGLVINIGDLLQLVSNGKFVSNMHRVVTSSIGPRISVACFFSGPQSTEPGKIYGPIEELLSEENPANYREVLLGDYMRKFLSTSLDENLGIDYYKL